MLATIRKNELKRELLIRRIVTVVEMAELFQVTEETIRRDLKALESEGVAKRIHGGAVLKEKVASSFDRITLKGIMPESKQGIAKLAGGHIANGLCIYMDASTTVQYLIPEISDKRITIVTNSFDIVNICIEYPNITVVQLGGILSHSRRCFTGSATSQMLNKYHFDMAVISCRTLSAEQGLADSDIEESEIKRQAIERSKHLMVLADYTKFNGISFVKIASLDKVDTLITDKPVCPKWEGLLLENQINYFSAM